MGTYTLSLKEIDDSELALAGGKGASLAKLARAGFPVPAGFVVTTSAYTDAVGAAGLTGETPERLRERIPEFALPDAIAAEVVEAYRRLGSPLVAVRSSGTAEDLADASFAGQHDTFLNVAGEEAVLAAIRDCWASLWTPRAVAYRQRYGWADEDLSLAVVVQVMVGAEWAGVMFTCDPVTGRRDQMVVEAVPGLGEALVSGEASGSRHVIDKRTRASRNASTHDAPLPQEVLDEVSRLGAEVEEAFGRPQDIEWARDGARVFLVQARPLTALGEEPGVPGERPGARGEEPGVPSGATGSPAVRSYGRMPRAGVQQLADHLPHPPFPLDVSLLHRPTARFVLGMFRSLGFTTPDVDDVLVEIDDGVVQIFPPKMRPTPQAAARIPAAAGKLLAANRVRPAAWLDRRGPELSSLVRRCEQEDLTALPERELFERVETLRWALGRFTQGRFLHALRGALTERSMAGLLWLAAGQRGVQLHQDLLADTPSLTAEGNRELDRLSGIIRQSPQLYEIYQETEPERVPQQLRQEPEGRALLDEVAAYLQRHGARETSIPTLGYPDLREDPTTVHALLAGMAAGERAASDPERAARARSAIVKAADTRTRLLGGLALRSLPGAREFVTFREDSHYLLFMPLPAMRRILLELGGRLVQRGVLAEREDVFSLYIDEVRTADATRTRETVRRRQVARTAALSTYTPFPAELLQQTNNAESVRGVPAARGSVTGRVRLVHGDKEFSRLRRGDVLVCPYTNPTWTPLFSLASAVVVDAGGAASHAAIVAREYGIPAVMGTGNATRLLRDGQRVLVSGDDGTVVPLGDGTAAGSAEVEGMARAGRMSPQGR